jgi:hypothetical protein
MNPEEIKEILANQREIMSQNAKLAQENLELKGLIQGDNQENTRIVRRITERLVEVRFVNNKVVVGFKNIGTQSRPQYVYSKPDPKNPRETIEFVDIILEDKTVLTVDYREFRRESAKAKCKVLKTEENEWVMNQGMVRKKEVEEYSSIELDMDVPLDVVGKTRFYTVQIPQDFGGAREMRIHENYVNI